MLMMAESNEILEGFLCPICKADLGTALQLHSHFQEAHSEVQEDVLSSLKGFLGKAKKKILKIDDELFTTEEEVSGSRPSRRYAPVEEETQELGVTRSHLALYRLARNERLERYAAETNKLLIRLDKLLNDLPVDALKRKAHEQAVVPWIEDRDVRLCPSCAKMFHLARRKHHCRLCGSIMCHDCTHFLHVSIARKMIGPNTDSVANSLQAPLAPLALKRSGSNTSLNSVLSLVDSVTGEQQFRLCVHCKQLLDSRERLRDERNLKPILIQFYDRLQKYEAEMNDLSPMYYLMWQSLGCGESTYKIADAQALRVKLLKLAELIDSLSKKIAVLGSKDVEPPRGNNLQLQLKVRAATTDYLRQRLLELPNLPTEQQLAEAQHNKRQQVAARIQLEQQRGRRAPAPAPARQPQGAAPPPPPSDQLVSESFGWGPESTLRFESDDPIIQQMNIIRNYIKQARAAHKYDEVSTLETNLRELQLEYYKQRQPDHSD